MSEAAGRHRQLHCKVTNTWSTQRHVQNLSSVINTNIVITLVKYEIS